MLTYYNYIIMLTYYNYIMLTYYIYIIMLAYYNYIIMLTYYIYNIMLTYYIYIIMLTYYNYIIMLTYYNYTIMTVCVSIYGPVQSPTQLTIGLGILTSPYASLQVLGMQHYLHKQISAAFTVYVNILNLQVFLYCFTF